MKTMCSAVLALCLTTAVGVNDETLGAGVIIKDATPILSIVDKPKDFVGKKVRIDGIATAVCAEMGCWLAVSDSDKKDAATIRLKVEHDGAIVFPMSAKGKHVSAEGVFESIGGADAHAKDASNEHAKQDAAASARYQIKATGAVIR